MIAKIWKKVLLGVLLIACLYNIMSKIITKVPLKEELSTSAKYSYEQQKNNK